MLRNKTASAQLEMRLHISPEPFEIHCRKRLITFDWPCRACTDQSRKRGATYAGSAYIIQPTRHVFETRTNNIKRIVSVISMPFVKSGILSELSVRCIFQISKGSRCCMMRERKRRIADRPSIDDVGWSTRIHAENTSVIPPSRNPQRSRGAG